YGQHSSEWTPKTPKRFRYRIRTPDSGRGGTRHVHVSGVTAGVRQRSKNHAARAGTRPDGQTDVEAAPEVDVARRAGAARRLLSRRHHWLVHRGRDQLRGPGRTAAAELDRGDPRRARRKREEGEGDAAADRRRGHAADVVGQSGRPDVDVDAKG